MSSDVHGNMAPPWNQCQHDWHDDATQERLSTGLTRILGVTLRIS